MISMKQFMDAVGHRITEGSEYGWSCFGPKAYCLDSWNGDHDGHSAAIVFDTETQVVYEVSVSDYTRNRAYRMINPDFLQAFKDETTERAVTDEAWDDVYYIDLDVDDDMMEKMKAIFAGQDYDTRVMVELHLDDETQLLLMKMAHEADMTLNDFVAKILREELDKIKPDVGGNYAPAPEFWFDDVDFTTHDTRSDGFVPGIGFDADFFKSPKKAKAKGKKDKKVK